MKLNQNVLEWEGGGGGCGGIKPKTICGVSMDIFWNFSTLSEYAGDLCFIFITLQVLC